MNVYLFKKVFLSKYLLILLITILLILSLPVVAVLSMGSDTITFLSGVSSLEEAETVGFYTGPSAPGNTYEWGNCTYWVYSMRYWADKPIPTTWGNANTWDDRAINDGYKVNQTPAVDSIMQSDKGRWGHVAFVTEVLDNGSWKISEMNVVGLNIVSNRTFTPEMASSYKFIHTDTF